MRVKPIATTIKEGTQQLGNTCAIKIINYISSTPLTPNHYRVLVYVYYHSGCRYHDIGNYYGWTGAYIYELVHSLKDSGYIDIVHLTKKTTYTTLTELGMKYVKGLLSIK